MAQKIITPADLMRFVEAVEAAFPVDAPRDRYGRYVGVRNTAVLRELAQKYELPHGGQDVQEQAGMVARAIMGCALAPE